MKRFFLALLLCFLLVPMLAQAVNVRAGIHARFNRLVFDWHDPNVKYTLLQENGQVTIQFNRSATANLSAVQKANLPLVRGLAQQTTAKGLQIKFKIPQNTRVQGFKVERNLAFDVLLLKKGQLTFAPSAAIKAPPALKPQIATPPLDTQNVTENTPTIKEPLKAPVENPVETITSKNFTIPVLPANDTMQPQDTKLAVQATIETRLAIWQRGQKLWVVLDAPLANLPLSIQGALAKLLSQPMYLVSADKKSTAFIFDLPISQQIFITFKSINNSWEIILSPTSADNTTQRLPDAMVTTLGQGVLTLFAGDQPVIAQFTDPWLGDQLAFVPVRRPESRIINTRRFAAFALPKTTIGAVITSSQNLAINAVLDKVDINLQGQPNLGFSDKTDQEKSLQTSIINTQNNAKDFILWPWPTLTRPEDITASRQFLEDIIIKTAKPKQKSQAYINFARYLLSQARGPEASGVLRLAALTNPDIANSLSYKTLAGIEAAMRAQTTLASEFFNHPTIMAQPAAHLWLGYSFALNENWRKARQAFALSQAATNNNPLTTLSPTWQVPMLLAMAEADLMAQDLTAAQQRLNKLPTNIMLTASQTAAKNYLISSIQQAAQQLKKSRKILEKLSKSQDQLYRVKAQLQLIEKEKNNKDFDLKNAIQTLEKMRYSWRGDQLEIRLLDMLGQLYIKDKRFFDGLTVWREAASLADDQTDTDKLATQMGDIFADLFVRNGADAISPLQALALYERFKELTPTGADGVIAQRNLAKRLQRIDLLDQADQLLQGVLQQQPLGELAAEIGTDLAKIRLKNRQPEKALKALDDSTPQGENTTAITLSQTLQEQRYFLRAKALADAGKRDDALAMLSNTTTEQGLSLSADLLWATGRWDLAAAELGKLLQLYPTATQSAEKETMQRRADVVLRQAIALTLAGDQMGLVTLTQTEQDFMATTPYAQNFNMITQSGSNGKLADLPTLEKYLNDVTLFEKFLQSDNKIKRINNEQTT